MAHGLPAGARQGRPAGCLVGRRQQRSGAGLRRARCADRAVGTAGDHAAASRRGLSRHLRHFSGGKPDAARGLRSAGHRRRTAPATAASGCATPRGARTNSRSARTSPRITHHPSPITGEADAYPFVRVEGEGVHEIPVGPGARRHDRTGTFPLLHRRRGRPASGGAARLQAQGHREALRADGPRSRARGSPDAFPAIPRWPMHGLMRWRSRAHAA